ncbi:outer membrane beta-barrel protein [Lewinella cohaerens]|uniref:outer membrane beta-barrel protein n=1 Tax=Lewinella cohaerens TaxID=70995 RepID=UPI0003A1930F|nr:outer membrane beta-barrel protein [Lewinella cohaerens]
MFKPGSWDQLAARLDEVDVADAFDEEIGERLQRMHVPYQQNSWAILAARLELERRRIQAITHYKIMELSLLLLLFITAWQHLPTAPTPPATPPPGIPFASTAPSPSPNDQDESSAIASSFVSDDQAASSSTAGTLAAEKSDSDLIKHFQEVNQLKEVAQRPVFARAEPLPANDLSRIPYEVDAQQQLKQFFAEKTETISTPSDDFHKEGALAALDGGKTALLNYGDPNELLEFIRPVERKTFLRIGFAGSPDYNRVITPSQELEDGSVVSYDRYSLGYSGGITLGVEHGKWEIETGAMYAVRRYQAIPTVYVTGTLREGYTGLGLRDFELNTVNIPLNFRYNFLLHDKWRMYAQGGASVNLILSANYYLTDQAEFAGIARNPNANSGSSALDKPEPLQNKALTAGWLEGGSFLQNATLYADFGVGLERYMTPNWSMFVQPTYHHSLPLFNDGLGPYRDRIHNFGIGMGVKVRL